MYIRRIFILTFFLALVSITSFAQYLTAQKTFGGSDDDSGWSIILCSDRSYAILGYTLSYDGDVNNNHGAYDVWFLKLDSNLNIIWNHSYGGSDVEGGQSVIQSSDHGFIMCGYTNSMDGNITGVHGFLEDVFLSKIDSVGHFQWEHSYGSFESDEGMKVIQTSDSGIIVLASAGADSGDVINEHGGQDIWVFKTDQNGNMLWQNCLGSWWDEDPGGIIATPDGGCIVVGGAAAQGGSISCSPAHMDLDVWITKLDSSGNQVWDKCYGSLGIDFAMDIVKGTGNTYWIGAHTDDSTGNVTGFNGMLDYWLLKIDDNGNLLWENCYGSDNWDYLNTLCATPDGGVVLAGSTFGVTGISSGNHGNADALLVKLDSLGNMEWSKCLGGTSVDNIFSMCLSPDSNIVFVGETQSNDGDVTSNHGMRDIWVGNINTRPVGIYDINPGSEKNIQVNINDNHMIVNYYDEIAEVFEIKLFDLLGEEICSKSMNSTVGANEIELNLPDMKTGIYYLKFMSSEKQWTFNLFIH